MTRPPWIGIVEVVPVPGNDIFDGAPGAFSNVLHLAGSDAEYRRLVRHAMTEMGLTVTLFDGVRTLAADEIGPPSEDPDDEGLFELVARVGEAEPFAYDTFYIYESETE